MSEYIVQVPDEKAEQFIARFGIEGTQVFGFQLTGEIVRCRDCMYYKPDPYPIDPGWPMYCEDSGRDMVEPDDYCAWAERKEGGDD